MFDNAKPGNFVLETGGRLGRESSRTRVKSVTKTHLILANGSRYSRTTGRKVKSDGWTWSLWIGPEAWKGIRAGIIRSASDEVSRCSYRVAERDANPETALFEMAEAIEYYKAKLAEFDAEFPTA